MLSRLMSLYALRKGLIVSISLFCFYAFSEEPVSNQDVYAEVVKQTQFLMLEKKRSEAINLAKARLAQIPLTTPDYNQLSSKITNLVLQYSKTFLTEEGQRLHGLGVDAIVESPGRAKTWFASSHEKVGGTNSLVVKDLSRLYLSQGRCSQALKLLGPAIELVPYDSGLQVYKMQVLECLDRSTEVFESLNEQFLQQNGLEKNPFLELYRIRKMVRDGQLEEGRLRLRQLKKDHPKFPDISYWLWKLDPLEGQIDVSHAQNYVNLCQNLSLRYRTKMFRQGYVCSQLAVVEAYLQPDK